MAVALVLVCATGPAATGAPLEDVPRGGIVFDCDRALDQEICRGDVRSDRVWRLTATRAWETEATWSPDRTRIAFSLHRRTPGSKTQIYLMDAHGSERTRLRQRRDRNNEQPAWSPSGRWIAFVSEATCNDGEDTNFEIWVTRPDGSGKRRLTRTCWDELEPEWSPNGRRIAFQSVDPGNPEIFVMRRDGSHVRRVTNHPAIDGNVAWSPDGRSIAFASTRSGYAQVYVKELNAKRATALTDGDANSLMPEWSPSGRRIVFVSDREGPLQLFVMGKRGRHERRLFAGKHYERPDWRPSPPRG